MAGAGQFQRGFHGFTFTDFTNQYYVWRFTQGTLEQSQASELAATAQVNNLERLFRGTQTQQMLHKASHYAAWMFHQSERINRQVTFDAAWRLAMENPDAKLLFDVQEQLPITYKKILTEERTIGDVTRPFTPQEARAFVFAKEAVRDTQFDYVRHMRPKFMQGAVKGTIFTFYMFMQNMMFFTAHQQGRARFLLMMLMMGGLMGLPGAEDVSAIARVIARRLFGKDFDVEREVRELALKLLGDDIEPDILLYGISRVGFGMPAAADLLGIPFPEFDLSANIGLGRLVPGLSEIAAPGVDFETRLARTSSQALGATFGIGINLMSAIDAAIENPSDYKVYERAMPRAARSLAKAVRFYKEGRERDRSGATIAYFPDDPEGMAEIIAQGLGFTPTKLSRQWDRRRMEIEAVAFWRIQREILMRQFDHTIEVDAPDAKKDVLAAIRRFNNEVPFRSMGIKRGDLVRSRKARLRARRLREAGVPAARRDAPLVRQIQDLFPEAPPPARQEGGDGEIEDIESAPSGR